MLQNAYFLAKVGADTAENEQHFAEILPKTGNYPTGPGGAGSIQEASEPAEVLEREKESVREVKDRLHDLRSAELARIQEVSENFDRIGKYVSRQAERRSLVGYCRTQKSLDRSDASSWTN